MAFINLRRSHAKSQHCETRQTSKHAYAKYTSHAHMLSPANKLKEQDAADIAYHGSHVC